MDYHDGRYRGALEADLTAFLYLCHALKAFVIIWPLKALLRVNLAAPGGSLRRLFEPEELASASF